MGTCAMYMYDASYDVYQLINFRNWYCNTPSISDGVNFTPTNEKLPQLCTFNLHLGIFVHMVYHL